MKARKFAIRLLLIGIILSTMAITMQAQTPVAPAAQDTISISLPPLTIPHSLTTTLMVIFGLWASVSEFLGFSKKASVNTTTQWLWNLIAGLGNSIKNAHNGNGGSSAPAAPDAAPK